MKALDSFRALIMDRTSGLYMCVYKDVLDTRVGCRTHPVWEFPQALSRSLCLPCVNTPGVRVLGNYAPPSFFKHVLTLF